MSEAWACAICSVLFDLDVGQRIDSIYPEGALTEEEANDVAFHSFPVPHPLWFQSYVAIRRSPCHTQWTVDDAGVASALERLTQLTQDSMSMELHSKSSVRDR